MGKAGRRAYGLDEIAIVPSRRTRDPEDVDLSWEIDAFQFDLPVIASGMDGVVSPATAIAFGRLGAVAAPQPRGPVDPLRGSRRRSSPRSPRRRTTRSTSGCREIYREPVEAGADPSSG